MSKLKRFIFFIAAAIAVLIGCKTQKSKFEFITPESGKTVEKGEKVQLRLNFPDTTVDSVVYSVDGDVVTTKSDTASIVFDTEKYGFGNRSITAKVYYAGKEEIAYNSITIVPPAPKQYSFEVINTFPHDSLAFTQGLQFENGVLYESTGLNERSSLRKVDFRTGNVLQKIDIDSKYFGEGMTIMGDKIILLTWREGVGFVYDKSTFKLLKTFNYKNPQLEGWGITYDGEKLITSDGTSKLYFLNKDTFQEVGSIEVFDDNGAVDNLNELEYINGKIYANLYYADRDEVVIIDPNTGIVEGRINFVGLYDGKRSYSGNEMNGIAHNPETGNLYVTGKDWTKLFEVKLIER